MMSMCLFCRTEPQLKKLQRECTELKEKISSIRNATQLLKTLKELKHEYVCKKKKNPKRKAVVSI